MSQAFIDLVDQFLDKMPSSDLKDALVQKRNEYFENPTISSLKSIRLLMRDFIQGDRFVFDKISTIETSRGGSGVSPVEGYYYDGGDEEAEEFSDIPDGIVLDIDPSDFDKSVDLQGFSFVEDTASDRFKGVSFREIIGVEEDYADDDDIARGRLIPPINLDDFPQLPGMEDPVKVIGIDVAAMGSDKTWFVFRHGWHVVDVWIFSHRNPMEICGFVVKAIEEFNPDEIVIDVTGGLGLGVSSRLEEIGVDEKCTITPVIFNAKPRDESLRCADQRAEMFYLLKERFLSGEITLPPHRELLKQLAYITYEIATDGSPLRISKKTKIKKELQASPDGADALALAFYSLGGIDVF